MSGIGRSCDGLLQGVRPALALGASEHRTMIAAGVRSMTGIWSKGRAEQLRWACWQVRHMPPLGW